MERLRGNFTWPLVIIVIIGVRDCESRSKGGPVFFVDGGGDGDGRGVLSSLECVNWGAHDCESRSKGGPVFLWMVVVVMVVMVVMVAHTV